MTSEEETKSENNWHSTWIIHDGMLNVWYINYISEIVIKNLRESATVELLSQPANEKFVMFPLTFWRLHRQFDEISIPLFVCVVISHSYALLDPW